MAKAKFTDSQIEQAKAWFFEDNTVVPVVVPGAGNNGPIIAYKKEEDYGNGEAASD